MYTYSEYDMIYEEFLEEQGIRKSKLKKIWGMLLGITSFVIVVSIVLFPNQFKSESTVWILPTFGGICFVVTFIGVLVSSFSISEKPYFQFLYPKIYEKINREEDLHITYKAYEKEKFTFNKNGGLFPKGANLYLKRHIQGKTENNNTFNIYDCMITTPNGNGTTTHFTGNYFVLQKKYDTSLQVRTNGRPNAKGKKFKRLKEVVGCKVYKELDDRISDIDQSMIDYYHQLKEEKNNIRVYLSVTKAELHIGIWYASNPSKRTKKIELETLNNYYHYFLSEYKMILDMEQINIF